MKKMAKISVRVTKNITLVLCYLVTMSLTACTLFIDEEDLPEELPTYEGTGYDERVTQKTEDFEVTYQYKETTMTLNTDDELMKYLVEVEEIDSSGAHRLYFDGNTPEHLIPRVGQCIVSNNTERFKYGLCDMVGISKKKDGRYYVLSKHTDVKDAFEYLKFKANVPVGKYLDEYDVYDDEGNFIMHVDNRKPATARNNGPAKVMAADDADDDHLNVNIPFDIPNDKIIPTLKRFGAKDKEHVEAKIIGGITGKVYFEADFDWDEGFYFDLKLKDGAFEIGVDITVTLGMTESKKMFGNDDLLNGRVKITAGPIVIVPVFGFSFNFKLNGTLSTSISYKKPFEFSVGFKDGDFSASNDSGEGEFEAKFEVNATASLPIVKISVGFGLFTSDLSLRAELYIQNVIKTGLASGTHNLTKGDIDIQLEPKLTCHVEIGFALALVGKGRLISAILDKVKESVKKVSEARTKLENYANGPMWSELLDFKNGKLGDIRPEVLEEIEKQLGGTTGEARSSLLDVLIEQKAQEVENLPTAEDTEHPTHVMSDEDREKECVLRLGPFYPELLKFNPYFERYLFPRIQSGSFRVGRVWNQTQDQLVFKAEYILDDPGLFSMVRDIYPCFLVKYGNQEIGLFQLDEAIPAFKSKGKRYSMWLNGLSENMSYTCIPCYMLKGEERPNIWDKGITFSTVTPSLSITDFVVTQNTQNSKYDSEGNITDTYYTYKFDTYTSVVGSRNVSEWGIMDMHDNNENTRAHYSKSATLKSGRYIHHWSVKDTKKSKIKIWLKPFVFAKDNNKSDWSEAKFYADYEQTIQSDYDFSDSKENSYIPAWQQPEYTLQLDSVSFAPDNYAEY